MFKKGDYVQYLPEGDIKRPYGEPEYIRTGEECIVSHVDGEVVRLVKDGDMSWWVEARHVRYSPFQKTIIRTELKGLRESV